MADAEILEIDQAALDKAVTLLRAGQLVAFPTETVYGLGADACNDKAVSSIFSVKGRPQFNPLIVHVASLAAAQQFAAFSPLAERLAHAFWPGSLTLVLPLKSDSGLSSFVTAGLDSVALRVPNHEAALALIEQFGGGLAAPSANPSGRLSPTEADHVEEGLGEKLALILDGGECMVGVESTIIKVADEKLTLLRSGGIAVTAINEVTGGKVLFPEAVKVHKGEVLPQSPGQLESHYAPNAELRLNAAQAGAGEMFLAFGDKGPENIPGLNLSPSGDLYEAATNLYAYLHILDDTGVAVINVMPIPNEGVGIAINDRLKRAAAPRGT